MTRCSLRMVCIITCLTLGSVPLAQGQVLVNPEFSDALAGWTTSHSGGTAAPGMVAVLNGQAVLTEGDSFLVTLKQTFTVPANPDRLAFDLTLNPGFDLADVFIPDAFEVSLLDNNKDSVIPTWQLGATSFFNLQEDGTAHLGSQAAFDGTTITADISTVLPGTVVTLYFDLIGGDADTASSVQIGSVVVSQMTTPPSNTPPTCVLGGPFEAVCAGDLTTVLLDIGTFADADNDPLTFSWTTDCPNASFDDPSKRTPQLTIDISGGCSLSCTVTVTVSDATANPVTCSTKLSVIQDDGPIEFAVTQEERITRTVTKGPLCGVGGFLPLLFTEVGLLWIITRRRRSCRTSSRRHRNR